MKRRKALKWLLIIVGIFGAIYISISFVYGIYLNTLFHEIYASKGVYTETLREKVSSDICVLLDFRTRHSDSGMLSDEYVRMSFPLAVHWGIGGQATYYYSYETTEISIGQLVSGSWDILLTVWFHLDGLKVIIDDIYEAP